MTYIIAQPCVNVLDRSCIEECPVDCIYEGERMLYIHPDECVDCGACEPVCPVEAIFYEDDVPDQWKDFYKANVEFFEDLGSPGGASRVGKIHKDHPLVAALPPQAEEGATRADARAAAAPVPLGPARPLPGQGQGPPGRDRGFVRRHPVDPVPRVVRGCAVGRGRQPRLPGHARHAAAARGRGRVAGPPPWGDRRSAGGPAADRHQGVHRGPARPARLRAGGRGGASAAGVPDLRHRRPAGRRDRSCRGRADCAGPWARPPGMGQLPVQSHWPGAAVCAPGQDGALGPGAGRGPRLGRVLHRPGLDRRAGVRAAPGGGRAGARRPARGALRVQAVEHGRLPGRFRHRRSRADRGAAGDPQARRDDDAQPRSRRP